jgi:hypothetical protein
VSLSAPLVSGKLVEKKTCFDTFLLIRSGFNL